MDWECVGLDLYTNETSPIKDMDNLGIGQGFPDDAVQTYESLWNGSTSLSHKTSNNFCHTNVDVDPSVFRQRLLFLKSFY